MSKMKNKRSLLILLFIEYIMQDKINLITINFTKPCNLLVMYKNEIFEVN